MNVPWRKILGFGARKAAEMAATGRIARLEAENAALREQVAYWQARAESLIDADRVQRGQAPVMSKSAAVAVNPFSGMAITAIRPEPARQEVADKA